MIDCIFGVLVWCQTNLVQTGPFWGRVAFVGVFAAMALWLILMPKRLVQEGDRAPPWWRNARYWALLIAAIQILVYLRFG